MSADSSAKKQGIARTQQKKHYCPCGKVAKAVQVMPGRRTQFECESSHRHPRKLITLR